MATGTFTPTSQAHPNAVGRFTFGDRPPAIVVPRWPGLELPAKHPALAHYDDYAYADSPAALERAAREQWWGIDTNMQPTADLDGICKHWPLARQDGYTHIWTGEVWGQGIIVPDPNPGQPMDKRRTSEVLRLTDAAGKRQLTTMADRFALAVKVGRRVVPEAKGSALFDRPEFWRKLGAAADAVGHPRMAMTLSDIGSPRRRARAAHAAGWQIALLPRKPVPSWHADVLSEFDAVWGDAWR